MAQLTAAEKAAREAHFAEHPTCWMCRFLGLKPELAELHHIAGRGKDAEVRENYAALCRTHHDRLQSQRGAELICLVLKLCYNCGHYSPEKVCALRGRAATAWVHVDVLMARDVMILMRNV